MITVPLSLLSSTGTSLNHRLHHLMAFSIRLYFLPLRHLLQGV